MKYLKKIPLLFFLILTISCGFQPILKDLDLTRISFKQINYTGDQRLIFLAKSNLNLRKNNSTNGYILDLSFSESKSTSSLDSAGNPNKEQLTVNIGMILKDNNNKIITQDRFEGSRTINVTSSLSADDQRLTLERLNITNELFPRILFSINLAFKE